MRFGTSAGATFAAARYLTCGAVNRRADALKPIADRSPFVCMCSNCIYGGKALGCSPCSSA